MQFHSHLMVLKLVNQSLKSVWIWFSEQSGSRGYTDAYFMLVDLLITAPRLTRSPFLTSRSLKKSYLSLVSSSFLLSLIFC